MKTGVKSIELSDYDEIKDEVDYLMWLQAELKRYCSARVDVGHTHKIWEWGRALFAMVETQDCKKDDYSGLLTLDIGAAYSLLGPALAYRGAAIVEAEPDGGCYPDRLKVNEFLRSRGKPEIAWVQAGYGSLHRAYTVSASRMFNAVFSISTIEHVEPRLEEMAWDEMTHFTEPEGLIVTTMDLMPRPGKGFVADDVRWTNYVMSDVKARVDKLKECGCVVLGDEDYKYHGSFVNDYSFAGIHVVKE